MRHLILVAFDLEVELWLALAEAARFSDDGADGNGNHAPHLLILTKCHAYQGNLFVCFSQHCLTCRRLQVSNDPEHGNDGAQGCQLI
jgi:hypothetical protein